MLVADTYIGHCDDPDVADRLADTDPARVTLSDTDRRRSRVRTETADGRDLGVVTGRDLEDGDVLTTDDGRLVVVELVPIDALVLDFGGADVAALTALELGHALGNRHWTLAVRDSEALFPVRDSREQMRGRVADHIPDGVETRFEAVPPTTFDDGENGDDRRPAGTHAHSHGTSSHSHDGGVHLVGGDES